MLFVAHMGVGLMIALVYQICVEISLVSLILIKFTCSSWQFTSCFNEKENYIL
jgi:hypothetical protein